MISFENVSKVYYSSKQALQSINFHIISGKMIFLVGSSGSGKSTLLKLLYGIERPTTGSVWFNGCEVNRLKKTKLPFLRRQIGMVFQDHRLLFDKNVYYNVSIPLLITGFSIDVIRRRVSAALDKVGLINRAKSFPIQLSHKEQKRISIARAIVNNPSVLLVDELTDCFDIDDKLSNNIIELFEEFNRIGVTVLIATHNPDLISSYKYSILKLNNGRMIEG
ncbi:Cell division ATP-binding protein FtsE [Candidatus Arsenophonus lipoptenae]|uniref:Cell division ATP-binding protein FtsE n=1 Tax=Candidatus Arsenophonus lipoptenae TaxID=634113 RepID=A0A109QEK5_9GAMM|nr:ATP-binding cassette domain-containing protein [Candidatus Arsenophonus lipoptenae]AMA64991.1 Cell division ATP-binding protein FtsE [Candidatus Arsenophonus lipoptenae]